MPVVVHRKRDVFLADKRYSLAVFEANKVASMMISQTFDFERERVSNLHHYNRVACMVRHPCERFVSLWNHFGPAVEVNTYIMRAINAKFSDPHWVPLAWWHQEALKRDDCQIVKLEECPDAWLQATGLGWPERKINHRPHRPWQELLNADTINAITDWAGDDFDQFGYEI